MILSILIVGCASSPPPPNISITNNYGVCVTLPSVTLSTEETLPLQEWCKGWGRINVNCKHIMLEKLSFMLYILAKILRLQNTFFTFILIDFWEASGPLARSMYSMTDLFGILNFVCYVTLWMWLSWNTTKVGGGGEVLQWERRALPHASWQRDKRALSSVSDEFFFLLLFQYLTIWKIILNENYFKHHVCNLLLENGYKEIRSRLWYGRRESCLNFPTKISGSRGEQHILDETFVSELFGFFKAVVE